VVVTESTADHPFAAIVRIALLAAAVGFAVATTSIHSRTAVGFALCATTMANAVPAALLHVPTAFFHALLAATMGLAELEVLRRALTAVDAAHELAAMASAAFIHLTDLVAPIDYTLSTAAVGNAVAATKVVLGAPDGLAALPRTFVLRADPSTDRPLFALLDLAFLATAVAFAEAASTVHFCTILRFAFLAAAMGNAKSTTDVTFLAIVLLTKPSTTMSFTDPAFHSFVLASFDGAKWFPTMARAVAVPLNLLWTAVLFALFAATVLDTVSITLVKLVATQLLAKLTVFMNRTAPIEPRRSARAPCAHLSIVLAAIL
jgi:hypothetical protein